MATNKNYILKKKTASTTQEIYKGITNGDISSLSRAITITESCKPADKQISNELIQLCSTKTNPSLRIGITGVPGVGKSTFIESFGELITKSNKKIAVLAVDPSSQHTGGSILGDKTRMEQLGRNPRVFIRPSPSGKNLGGVARSTRESILLCEAAGFDIILIETVGVGQSETEVHSMVDFFLLLMLAGAGDELQGIKRGIMEMADLIVINKADGTNVTKAKGAKKLLQSALHYFPPHKSGWAVKTMTCSALENVGIDEIWQTCLDFEKQQLKNGYLISNRSQQNSDWFQKTLSTQFQELIIGKPEISDLIKTNETKILSGQISPFQAVDEIIEAFAKSFT